MASTSVSVFGSTIGMTSVIQSDGQRGGPHPADSPVQYAIPAVPSVDIKPVHVNLRGGF
jgi:hypothetical protein